MVEVTIKTLGRKGDGIATDGGQDIFVPFTLEGERVDVTGSGPRRELQSVINASKNRIEPICKHFTTCGGCQLQHMSDAAYLAWKETLALEPLKKAGIEIATNPIISVENATRRKVAFNLTHSEMGVTLGFSEPASNRVVPITECSVVVPAITDRLDDLLDLASSLPVMKSGTRMAVLATDNGLDICVDGVNALSTDQRQVLIRKTIALQFARLTVDGETLIEVQKPILLIDELPITPPPGSFVQAANEAERTMIELATECLKSCKNVADLFCGVGTFALPLARKSTVWAVEESKPALEALDVAWRGTAGKLKQVKTEARNLERRPVTFSELKKFDGLIFDPPRAGAELQAKQIAKSRVQKIVAVSCNPVTLARDLEILIDGGFQIQSITPIDQFKFTPHVEMVVTLGR